MRSSLNQQEYQHEISFSDIRHSLLAILPLPAFHRYFAGFAVFLRTNTRGSAW